MRNTRLAPAGHRQYDTNQQSSNGNRYFRQQVIHGFIPVVNVQVSRDLSKCGLHLQPPFSPLEGWLIKPARRVGFSFMYDTVNRSTLRNFQNTRFLFKTVLHTYFICAKFLGRIWKQRMDVEPKAGLCSKIIT
jgi:hypothetical protein